MEGKESYKQLDEIQESLTNAVIIDGVNVAGCEFYIQDEKYSCDLSFINQEELCKCDDVQDCTYKQLKRAEIEIEKLKGVDGSVHPDSAYYKITRLEQENKQMKSALEEIKELNKHCADCEGNTCGVCAAADGKPNNSYRIANEALK